LVQVEMELVPFLKVANCTDLHVNSS